MTTIRKDRVYAAYNKTYDPTNLSKYNKAYDSTNSIDELFEIRRQIILDDESLTEDEKSEVIKLSRKDLDRYKLTNNIGTKRICESCQNECLAILFCEHCVRNYLKAKFSNWTSGNNDIDDLIQQCQLETIAPDGIIEWFPYENLRNIKYLSEGGCSVVYAADLIGGCYETWDSNEKKLLRLHRKVAKHVSPISVQGHELAQKVILKKLGNLESASESWREEMKTHLILSNRYPGHVVPCYGLTKEPSDNNYMLVLNRLSMDLRKYLQENHNKLNWEERIQIVRHIIDALTAIHRNKIIHGDLHSGNILFNEISQTFCISDLGLCGPVDKPLNSIYGKLPYMAPEVIRGKGTTFVSDIHSSDIYSFGMLMWEISSGKPPFFNYKHGNSNLVIDIANGIRPEIISGTPLEYKELMEKCWIADPLERPFFLQLWYKINVKINTSNCYQSKSGNVPETNNILEIRSKVYNFENVPEPRNATEEEQKEFHSKCYSSNDGDGKELLKVLEKLQINSKSDDGKELPNVFKILPKSGPPVIMLQSQTENNVNEYFEYDHDDDNDNHAPNFHSTKEQDNYDDFLI